MISNKDKKGQGPAPAPASAASGAKKNLKSAPPQKVKKGGKKGKAGGKGKRKKGGVAQVFIIMGVLLGVLFAPTTMILVCGMVPTPMAILVDKTKRQAKLIAIGSLNLAGCSPFIIDLWTFGNSFEKSIDILSSGTTWLVMYGFAAFAYGVNSVVTSAVAAGMQQNGKRRKKEIIKRQKELVDRWGEKVTGQLPLDEDGFPVEQPKGKPAAKPQTAKEQKKAEEEERAAKESEKPQE